MSLLSSENVRAKDRWKLSAIAVADNNTKNFSLTGFFI